MSKIEWTEETWNPIKGCSKVSAGCKNCYAEVMAKRLQAIGVKGYEDGFKVRLMPDKLNKPLKKRKPTTYFVNSMSDLFHQEIPFEYIDRVFEVIEKTPHHTYQILTKREKRMYEYAKNHTFQENTLLGATIENQKAKNRIDYLRDLKVKTFLSIEPLLEDLGKVDFTSIDWVIVGGESGCNARPMKKEWVENIQKQCLEQKIPFFFKQWGAYDEFGKKSSKKTNGRLLNGVEWNEIPNQSKEKSFIFS